MFILPSFVEISSEKKIHQIQVYAYNKAVVTLTTGKELSVSLNFPKLNEAKLIHYLAQSHFTATELSDGSYMVSANLKLNGGGLFDRIRSIHKAAAAGDIASLKDCLDRKVPNRYSVDIAYLVPGPDLRRRTALQIACESDGSANFVEIVTLLIKASANVNLAPNGRYQTPLALAMKKNNFEIAAKLIEAGADVNCRVEVRADGRIQNVTPLQIACRKEKLELVQLMLEKGAKVNETGTADVAYNEEDSWFSPLAEAAKAKNISIAKVLIAAEATCSVVTDVTRTRKYDAQTKTTSQTVNTKAIDFNEWACWSINLEFLKLLIEEGVKYTFLHKAAKYGNNVAIEYLLSCGYDVDVYDEKNVTPLAVALKEKKFDAANLLLDMGANRTKILPSIFSELGSDAQYVLDCHKPKQVMPFTRIPQPTSSDLFNSTYQRSDFSGVALSTGLQPDSKALTLACSSGKMEMVDQLLAKGAKPDSETLTAACATNNIAIVDKMIKCGAKPTKQTIEIAKQTKNFEILNRILELMSQNL